MGLLVALAWLWTAATRRRVQVQPSFVDRVAPHLRGRAPLVLAAVLGTLLAGAGTIALLRRSHRWATGDPDGTQQDPHEIRSTEGAPERSYAEIIPAG